MFDVKTRHSVITVYGKDSGYDMVVAVTCKHNGIELSRLFTSETDRGLEFERAMDVAKVWDDCIEDALRLAA